MIAILSKEGGGYDLYRIDKDGKRVTFASTQDFKQKLSLKNCQAIERGYDLDELVKGFIERTGYNDFDSYSYKLGFQKALELNSTKLFTLEDMMNCWNKALKFQDHKETLVEHIQSIQQTEWEVEIEMENVMHDYNGNISLGAKFKLDADGCLILKLKSE
jgi:hypothetical protein